MNLKTVTNDWKGSFLAALLGKSKFPAPRNTDTIRTNTLTSTMKFFNAEGNEIQSQTRNLHTGDHTFINFKDGSRIEIIPSSNIEGEAQ